MNKTLTIEGFSLLNELGYDETKGLEHQKNTLSILTGQKSSKVGSMTPDKFQEMKQGILSQMTSGDPIYLVKYKDEMYGYVPLELDTVEAMSAFEAFQKRKNWTAIAALMFRPVTRTTKLLNRRGWSKRHEIKVKEITNLSKDRLSYRVKKSYDFSRVDLDHFNDFPVNLLLSNLVFSVGSGLQYSQSILLSSLQSQRIQKVIKEMSQKTILALISSVLRCPSLGLGRLNSLVGNPSLTSDQESSLNGSIKSQLTKLRKEIVELGKVITGKNNKITVEGIMNSFDRLIIGESNTNDLILFSAMAKSEKQIHKLWLR